MHKRVSKGIDELVGQHALAPGGRDFSKCRSIATIVAGSGFIERTAGRMLRRYNIEHPMQGTVCNRCLNDAHNIVPVHHVHRPFGTCYIGTPGDEPAWVAIWTEESA